MANRKPKKFYVTRGLLMGEGASKPEAKADLDRQVSWACSHASMHCEARFGLMLVLAASCGGWEYTIIEQGDMNQHGKVKRLTCSMGQCEMTEALNRVRNHAAQWAWSHDVADDAQFVASAALLPETARDLASWIRFQRSYQAHRAAGMSDVQAFAAANGVPVS